MATNLSQVLQHLHHLLGTPGGDRTDGELLERFVAARDEAAFAALMRRHGPMVLAVCRRMLRHLQDAEDCFQATFLVLARKAATVKRDSLGNWLYAVAYRTALEARTVNARRQKHEKQVPDMPHPEVMPPEVQDWRPYLDRELNRLPEKYRAAIVACDLEGRSRKEAARLLGIAEGTLSSRLARGRSLLAKRLAPYGLLSSVALTATLVESAASAQVPAILLSSTTKAALLVAAGKFTAASASSAVLMKGVLKSMFLTKLKMMVGTMLVVTALGASGLVYHATGQTTAAARTDALRAEKRSDGKQKPRSELERLRHENELLKLNLEVVLEKVHAQEAELRVLRGQAKWKKQRVPPGWGTGQGGMMQPGMAGMMQPGGPPGARPASVLPPGGPPGGFPGGVPPGMPGGPPPGSGKPGAAPVREDDLRRTIDVLEKTLKELRKQLKKPDKGNRGKR